MAKTTLSVLPDDFGRECLQSSVRADLLDEQVIRVLKTLKPPAN
jgi:hypothetical protein